MTRLCWGIVSSRSAAAELAVGLEGKAGYQIADRSVVVRREDGRSRRPAVADRSICVRRTASRAWNRHAARRTRGRIGLTRTATPGNRKHVIVSVQDFGVSPVAASRNRRGAGTTAGAHADCQDLALLDRQDCTRVGSATSAASSIAVDNGSASAGAIDHHTEPADAGWHDERAGGLEFLSAIKTRSRRSSGTLRSGWSRWTC